MLERPKMHGTEIAAPLFSTGFTEACLKEKEKCLTGWESQIAPGSNTDNIVKPNMTQGALLCFYDFCLPAFGLVSCSVSRCCLYIIS